ncbi:MAG: lipopolysaccharide biosynthesis protein, partial [Gammaproteobacteria bacterium]
AYDSVVIDSPPVELVSDARVLAAQATGIVYVMKADDTPYQLARQGIKNLSKTGTPIIGAVLNQVDPKKTASYGKYGKYGAYYSRYGYSAAAS